jgi:uncharacterized protein
LVIPASDSALLAAAGVVAGIIGTAGGITSLVSYPALLAAGLPAFPANVANIVALVACWPGSALASRPELGGRAGWLARWGLLAAAGGAAGAVLFLSTPSRAFGRVVPFLIAAGSIALLLQPRLSALQQHESVHRGLILAAGLFAVSAYSGYFGAGSGVMTLALMLILEDPHLARANALKNMLVGAATIVSALLFVSLERVEWSAVIPLAAGLFAGSLIGPRLARRLPAALLRWLVALVGLALAVKLWIAPA